MDLGYANALFRRSDGSRRRFVLGCGGKNRACRLLSREDEPVGMKAALYFLVFLGALGAFDTLYYHEWRLRLPDSPAAATELRLHSVRDFAYTIVFATLAWTTWNGLFVWPLAA